MRDVEEDTEDEDDEDEKGEDRKDDEDAEDTGSGHCGFVLVYQIIALVGYRITVLLNVIRTNPALHLTGGFPIHRTPVLLRHSSSA